MGGPEDSNALWHALADFISLPSQALASALPIQRKLGDRETTKVRP